MSSVALRYTRTSSSCGLVRYLLIQKTFFSYTSIRVIPSLVPLCQLLLGQDVTFWLFIANVPGSGSLVYCIPYCSLIIYYSQSRAPCPKRCLEDDSGATLFKYTSLTKARLSDCSPTSLKLNGVASQTPVLLPLRRSWNHPRMPFVVHPWQSGALELACSCAPGTANVLWVNERVHPTATMRRSRVVNYRCYSCASTRPPPRGTGFRERPRTRQLGRQGWARCSACESLRQGIRQGIRHDYGFPYGPGLTEPRQGGKA
jgi:hypothetical protein